MSLAIDIVIDCLGDRNAYGLVNLMISSCRDSFVKNPKIVYDPIYYRIEISGIFAESELMQELDRRASVDGFKVIKPYVK